MNSSTPSAPRSAATNERLRALPVGPVPAQLNARAHRAMVVVQRAAMLAVLLLSPSTYATHRARRRFVIRIYRSTTTGLLTFLLLSTSMSGVLVLLFASAARGFGLSPFALEGIVRVLLLELIPLLAAVFVLVEVTLPAAALLSVRRAGSPLHPVGTLPAHGRGDDMLREAALPRALAGMVAPLVFCVIASWIALALAYLILYGTTPWALQGFARVLGNVFEPAVAIVWSFKIIAFSVGLSLLPIAAAITPPRNQRVDPVDLTLTTLVRTGALLLLIELIALLAIYA